MLDNNYYNYRYTSCRTYGADARGKSADGSVNWYTAVTRDGRQWSHLCLRDIKVFKRRFALTMCVNVSHTNKQTFHGGRRKSKMIYSREKRRNCGVVFGLWIRFDINGYGADLPPRSRTHWQEVH